MKQKFLRTAFFALSVFALVSLSCENASGPGGGSEEEILYTTDGRRMVNLTINFGGNGASHSLAPGYARDAINYYEVIFKEGTTYYRAAARKDQVLKISVPPNTYGKLATGSNAAVLLAGTLSDKTLLAAGSITGTGAIGLSDKTVTFQLEALEATVIAGVPSAFEISGAGGVYDTDEPSSATVNSITVPCFLLPLSKNGITAKYTIGGFTSNFGNMLFLVTPGATDQLVNFSTYKGSTAGLIGKIGTITTVPAAGLVIGNVNLVISILLETYSTSATSLLVINGIPVRGMSADTTGPGEIWYIRAGINGYEVDTGEATIGGVNGGILLDTGTGIIVSPSGP